MSDIGSEYFASSDVIRNLHLKREMGMLLVTRAIYKAIRIVQLCLPN
jgi:hypothetical protein